MPRILISAFEPYDRWSENSSWLALVEFTKTMQADPEITTRRYPVDFEALRARLEHDLSEDYDYALHLGQAPGAGLIHLEAIGLNVGGNLHEPRERHGLLVESGPVAYRSTLPLNDWALQLRGQGIPVAVSYHAGTYLCNATLYLTHYLAERQRLRTQATFLHLPLDTAQAAIESKEIASLPKSVSALAVAQLVKLLVRHSRLRAPELA